MSSPVTLYGISNCDTIKKVKSWLDQHQVNYDFHDYRKQGLDAPLLRQMSAALGWENMLNRRGTTWRKLPEQTRQQLDVERALEIMLENPAIIKRPILGREDRWYLGFSPQQYEDIFA